MFKVFVTDGTVFYSGDDRSIAHDIYRRTVRAFKNDGRTFNMHVFLTSGKDNVLLLSEKI